MSPRTILTMSNGKGVTAALLLLALTSCTPDVPPAGQQQYPCNPYCMPRPAR